MKGKLLRGISGSIQPRRLLPGYQDAVFAWSGENPYANLAQSSLYRILPRPGYSDSWIKSTPYGQALRADAYYGSGHGYVHSSHVPNAPITYAVGVTGYAEFIYSADLQSSQYTQHLCCLTSTADGNTGESQSGVLTFGLEVRSGLNPVFRVGDSARLFGFAGGWADSGSGSLVPVSIPIGAKVRQMATFDPVSKAYAAILTVNDVIYEVSGTAPNGLSAGGSSIVIGGYQRSGVRASYAAGMLEAAIWRRGMPPDEMRALLQRPSIFQPTEFIFPFSFGESSGGSEVINTVPDAIALSPVQAWLYSTEILSGKPAGITLQGNQALIQSTGVVDTWPDSLGIYGQKADISMSMALATNLGNMTFAGLSAQINIQSPLVWGGTTIEARLQGMTIETKLQGMTIEAKQ